MQKYPNTVRVKDFGLFWLVQPVNLPFVLFYFQIVGVCAEELRSAQHWNGPGVLDLLKQSTM